MHGGDSELRYSVHSTPPRWRYIRYAAAVLYDVVHLRVQVCLQNFCVRDYTPIGIHGRRITGVRSFRFLHSLFVLGIPPIWRWRHHCHPVYNNDDDDNEKIQLVHFFTVLAIFSHK